MTAAAPSEAKAASGAELLATDNLCIQFGGLRAVDKVKLCVREGEIVGLIGPNGAGKTTCFNMVTGVYKPTEGEIRLGGARIDGHSTFEINRMGIARTFQNIRLFKAMSVLDNVRVALHGKVDYGLVGAICRLGAYKRTEQALIDRAIELLKVFGLEKRLKNEAGGLPYGEQRKLEIVRALATSPKLLLLDEPAAGMNPQETAQLTKLIHKLRDDFKITVLLIEHDMSLVMKICERIYVLDYGKEIAHGTPAEIQANPQVIKAYLGEA
jgi:branched-chain amino acid transport system ATP-binding protein